MGLADSYTSHLLGSLAAPLDMAGTGVWRPDGVITADESGIFRAVVPAEPGWAIGLTAYPWKRQSGSTPFEGRPTRAVPDDEFAPTAVASGSRAAPPRSPET